MLQLDFGSWHLCVFGSLVTVFRNRQKGQPRSASFGVKATIASPRYNAALTDVTKILSA